ncbi:MAG: CDP-alcohol phosphatidyltransferase family protein [candidate division Zixibacteria bacterium]|nr:CDP-alcohol phosphatidyltransferase family protein [candidate division Zixibacteria bacterium]
MTSNDSSQFSSDRVQTSILSRPEKIALQWLAPRLPRWVSPDLLTFIGLFAMGLTGLGYYLAKFNDGFLWLASFGLALNWFGDSLDGTLARVRNQQRPKYGYYLDHLVDAFGVSIMIYGLAYSELASPEILWAILTLFLIASINAYLAAGAVNVLKISYAKISTTEARVILIILNVVLLFAKKVTIFGHRLHLLDFLSLPIAIFLLYTIIRSASLCLRQLDKEERAKWGK